MVVRTLSLVQKGQTSGRSTQWMQWNSSCSMQWMQWNSGIWWWGHCLLVQKGLTSGCSGRSCSRCRIHCIHWFDHFAPKTMSHYSTASTVYCIHCLLHLLCTACTASTGLTFLHQRECPHHHTPLFHCIHCILCPLHTASTASTRSSHLCVILTQPDILYM